MPSHPRNLIGPQLRRIRTERGLSQAALAADCQRAGWDISRDIVKHIEDGKRWVSDMELLLLTEVLGLPVDGLFPARKQALKLALARLAE
jgi:transcriptional regulator with XRE-family HTH domain